MQFSDCRVGMEVLFGKGNGEYTRGVVEKMNRVKAKVRTIENRGKTIAGTVWSVPYSLMNVAGSSPTPPSLPEIKFHVFQDPIEQSILETINLIYNALSPENISCDGEIPLSVVQSRRAKYNRQLRGLFQALGREVDESTAYNWYKEKQEFERNQKVHKSV